PGPDLERIRHPALWPLAVDRRRKDTPHTALVSEPGTLGARYWSVRSWREESDGIYCGCDEIAHPRLHALRLSRGVYFLSHIRDVRIRRWTSRSVGLFDHYAGRRGSCGPIHRFRIAFPDGS